MLPWVMDMIICYEVRAMLQWVVDMIICYEGRYCREWWRWSFAMRGDVAVSGGHDHLLWGAMLPWVMDVIFLLWGVMLPWVLGVICNLLWGEILPWVVDVIFCYGAMLPWVVDMICTLLLGAMPWLVDVIFLLWWVMLSWVVGVICTLLWGAMLPWVVDVIFCYEGWCCREWWVWSVGVMLPWMVDVVSADLYAETRSTIDSLIPTTACSKALGFIRSGLGFILMSPRCACDNQIGLSITWPPY